MTEQQFVAELLTMNEELNGLNGQARTLEQTIDRNVMKLAGEA